MSFITFNVLENVSKRVRHHIKDCEWDLQPVRAASEF